MSTEMTVETYMKWIRRNLHGIERDNIDNIVEELQGHINEKAQDRAEEKGLKAPDEKIYQDVLEELGPPEEVAIDYLKILPKKPSLGLRLFMGLQFSMGLLGILVSIIYFSLAVGQLSASDPDGYLGIYVLIGLVFLVVGLGTVSLILLQYKRPTLIVHYQSGSVMLSLMLCAGFLFTIMNYLIWRFLHLDLGYEQTTSIAMPVFLGLNLVYIMGLRFSEEFQRRISLEEIDNKLFEKKRSSSNKAMAALAIVTLILVSASSVAVYKVNEEPSPKDQLISTEQIGGKYNATLEHWEYFVKDQGIWVDYLKIIYTKNGTVHKGVMDPALIDAMVWIRDHTDADAKFLSWWDYGHPITGYSSKDTVICNPSENLRNTLADPSEQKEWDTQDSTQKVAKALTASDINQTLALMNETGAKYLFTSERDLYGIAYAIFQGAGLDSKEYLNYDEIHNYESPNAKGNQTTLVKMWQGQDLPGLKLVYSDLETRIYKME